MKALPLIAAFALLAAAPLAHASDLTDAVPGHPGLTYFDLMKLVVTDLAPGPNGAQGSKVVPLAHLEGKDSWVDLSGSIVLASVDAIPLAGDRVLVMADMGPSEGYVAEPNVLALFALVPKPRLLDAVEVGTDRFVGVRVQTKTMLAAGAPLIVVDSEHDNSNESYLSTAMLFIRHDHFRWIDSVFTFSVRFCGYNRRQEPAFTLGPVGPVFRSIHVRVEEVTSHEDEECDADAKIPKVGKRYWRTTYAWNAKKGDYFPNNDAMKRLMEEDAKAF